MWEKNIQQGPGRTFSRTAHYQLALTPDGRWLAYLDGNKSVVVDLKAPPDQVPLIFEHDKTPSGITLRPDGKAVTVTRLNENAKIYDIVNNTFQLAHTLHSNNNSADNAMYSPDGSILLIGGNYHFEIWDVMRNPPKKKTSFLGWAPCRYDFTRKGDRFALQSEEGFVHLFDLGPDKVEEILPHDPASVFSIRYVDLPAMVVQNKLGIVATSHQDGPSRAYFWDLTGKSPQLWPRLTEPFVSESVLAWNRKGDRVLVHKGAELQVLEPQDKDWKEPKILKSRFTGYRFAGFVGDEDFVFVRSTGFGAKLIGFNLDAPEQEFPLFELEGKGQRRFSACANGSYFGAFSTENGPIFSRYHVEAGKSILTHTLAAVDKDVSREQFDADGDYLVQVIGGNSNTYGVRVLDFRGKEAKEIMNVRTGSHPFSVALSKNAKYLAAWLDSQDPQLTLWDVATQKKLRVWTMPGRIAHLTFADDNRHLFCINGNKTFYVLRLAPPGDGAAVQAPPMPPQTKTAVGPVSQAWGDYDLGKSILMGDFVQVRGVGRISSKHAYSGPPEITTVARTEKTNIRLFAYSGGLVIFNWENKLDQLRVHRPADDELGRTSKTATGPLEILTPNTWYKLHWKVTRNEIEVAVNDKVIFTEKGNYNLNFPRPAGVVANGSVLEVKSLIIKPLPE